MFKTLQILIDSGKITQEEANSLIKEIKPIQQELEKLKKEKEELSRERST